jgi:hypothetical protein
MRSLWKSCVRLSLFACCVSLTGWVSASSASAQALAVSGNHFTVDGTAKFLMFVTYFDANDVPNAELETDLTNLKNAGIDGIRVMPNWWTQTARISTRTFAGDTVIDANGNIQSGPWNNLVWVLDRARAHGLLVDVSFSAESVACDGCGGPSLDYAHFKAGIGTITSWLASASYNHVLFDIQNESNKSGNGPLGVALSDSQVLDIRNYIKSIDASRIVTASCDHNLTTSGTRDRANTAQLDVVAWHEPRDPSWWTSTFSEVPTLRGSGKPAYLQEPPKFEDVSSSTEDFLRAAEEAKKAGAAAWCYHTSAGQWMNADPSVNPNGGIWPRMVTSGSGDWSAIDRDVIAGLWGRVSGASWGI